MMRRKRQSAAQFRRKARRRARFRGSAMGRRASAWKNSGKGSGPVQGKEDKRVHISTKEVRQRKDVFVVTRSVKKSPSSKGTGKSRDGGHRVTDFRFSGHQTFPFRYGWLKKAADHVDAFNSMDAIVKLGVGKNMVASIRHWALASQLFSDHGRGTIALTFPGRKLLKEWDPYLEDPGTLWFIHWKLTTNPSRAAAWFLAFHRFPRAEFTKAELVEYLLDFVMANELRPKRNTLARDVDCLVRTYVPSRSSEVKFIEDSFDCPLVELGLIQRLRDGETFQFAVGSKSTLPAEVFGAALFEFMESKGDVDTIPVHECVYGVGSPGQAFKLDENSVMEYLGEVQKITQGIIDVDDTSGLKQVYRRGQVESTSLLQQYFGKGNIP